MIRFLIVEGAQTFGRSLRRLLEERCASTDIQEARNVQEAMNLLETVRPDFIFLDVRLPDGSGFDLCERMKKIRPKAVIILLTDYDIPEYGEAALRSGADVLISKSSFAHDRIVALIETKEATVGAG